MIHVGRTRYPYLEEVNEGITREFDHLPSDGKKVLDVGCGRGQLGEAIRKKGFTVWGIEQDPEACDMAGNRIDRLIRSSLLDYDNVEREIGEERFDYLIFSDVLEHLYDPRTVLEKYRKFLKSDAQVLVSVPNGVVWTNRIQWLLGRIEYQDTGVMDRTHVRFFTFRTAQRLVNASGFRVVRTSSTPHIVRAALPVMKRFLGNQITNGDPRAFIDSPSYKKYMRYVYPIERRIAGLWRGMFTFRIIVVGQVSHDQSAHGAAT